MNSLFQAWIFFVEKIFNYYETKDLFQIF